MLAHQLSNDDEAVLRCFHEAQAAVGLDGNYSLSSDDRGVLAVAEFVRSRTLLQVYSALGLGGKAAAECTFKTAGVAAPNSIADVDQALRQLYQIV